jgi:hypothetical protein
MGSVANRSRARDDSNVRPLPSEFSLLHEAPRQRHEPAERKPHNLSNLFNAFALYVRYVSVDWLLKVHAPFWSGSFF